MDKNKYEVTVYNGKGSSVYITENIDVTQNYIMGNTLMITFRTVDNVIVTLPNTVIVEQSELVTD